MVKLLVDEHNWKEALPIAVMHYRDMEMMNPGSDLLARVRKQYANMAAGGDGGPVERELAPRDLHDMRYTSVREESYPDVPNEFFQELCDLLGWER